MNKVAVRFAVHAVVILMIFILPEVVLFGSRPANDVFRWVPYAKVAVFVAVFYMEYLLLGISPSRLRFVIGSVVILCAGVLGMYMLFDYVGQVIGRHVPALHAVIRDIVMLVLTMGLSVAMRLSERMGQIEATHKEEELKQLKSQLNPHFLFNSLNTVYALTEIDPPAAREAVHRLSALLRYALYEADSTTVKLGREVAFIKDYVRLMQMRMGDSITVSMVIEIDSEMEDKEIASMLFVTLVENAFKHGGPGTSGSYVSIRINASLSGNVECDVANSVSAGTAGSKRGGVGLENLRRRLGLIYGDRASLEISSQPAIFVAQMKIEI